MRALTRRIHCRFSRLISKFKSIFQPKGTAGTGTWKAWRAWDTVSVGLFLFHLVIFGMIDCFYYHSCCCFSGCSGGCCLSAVMMVPQQLLAHLLCDANTQQFTAELIGDGEVGGGRWKGCHGKTTR